MTRVLRRGGTGAGRRLGASVPADRAGAGAEPARPGRGPRALDLLFLSALALGVLWAGAVTVLGGRELAEAGRYLAAPAVLAGGVLLGRFVGLGVEARSGAIRAASVLLLPAWLCLLAAGVLGSSLYANAQAAVGLQIVALAALLLTSVLRGEPDERPRGLLLAGSVLLAVLAALLGMVLAGRAQAAFLLVIVMVVLAVLALARPALVRRRVSAGLGTAAIGAALAVVLALASLTAWPRWLGDQHSLSFARQLLWKDAVELWGSHPLVGGGPGSFYDSSPIARSEPHLYAAHSSVLQAGSELGTPAALLLLAVLVLGVLLAARADRTRALIGVAAWSALAVHSMIDHLYEFPMVVLLAGIVIGWAGARPVRRAGSAHGPEARPDR